MSPRAGLEVRGLTVAYGGIVAVDDVSVDAPRGRVTALIGPNGAGKTSTLDACSGLVRPSRGTIRIDGRDVTRLPVHRRAQLGLGRTFQRMQLCESLTVHDNIELGREARLAGSNPLLHISAARKEVKETRSIVADAMSMCGLERLEHRHVVELSTGQRRLVELARAIASGADLLLLDEPSSGLDDSETAEFGDVVSALLAERGVGVLMVEHDMNLVMSITDHLYVLDFGTLIFDGTPRDAAANALVRSSYLGAELP